MRVLDFGPVSARRSQTLWHAVAKGVAAGSPATLSMMHPTEPYVSIGFHSDVATIDRAFCRKAGLPVFRRMVGGGPVYLDHRQHFFQIAVHKSELPATRPAALRRLLDPAVSAFRAAGIDAVLDDNLEIVVGEAKVCGHAAGEIDDAVVVVGNLITGFDHDRATRILAMPHEEARDELRELMGRYVTATPADPTVFNQGLVEAYADALELEPRAGDPTPYEWDKVDEFDLLLGEPDWLGRTIRAPAPSWRVKVRAGVWLYAAEADDTRLAAGLRGDEIVGIRLADPGLNGRSTEVAASLIGMTLRDAKAALGDFGRPGERLGSLLAEVEDGRKETT